jgi:hypothetical protein
MVQVGSEAIAEIAYDAARSALLVRFVDGDWYTYFDVAADVYSAFLTADSHGRFFHQHILDRYRFGRGRH